MKMLKLSKLRYTSNRGDNELASLSVEEFESWRAEQKLDDEDLYKFQYRRRTLTEAFEMSLEAYRNDEISLTGKRGLLASLKRMTTEQDLAIFGRIVFHALNHESEKKPGPSENLNSFRKEIEFYMNFLANQPRGEPMLGFPRYVVRNDKQIEYPGTSKEDYMVFIVERFKALDLSELIPSVDFLREFLRSRKTKI